MADFLKCCFPSASAEDDEIELVSAAGLPGSRRSMHNEKLKASISRPIPQPKLDNPQNAPWPSIDNPYMPRRPSLDLQDLVEDDDDEPEQENTFVAPFNTRDRAHGHVLRDLGAALKHSKWAVSGSYAESLWECPGTHRPNTVSIMCSSASATTTKVWLTSQSLFTVSATDENILDYQGDTKDHAPLAVRIRWVSDRELDRLAKIEGSFNFREGPGEPPRRIFFMLLALPALADNLALSWVKATDVRVKKDFAADLFAVLARIAQLDFSILGAGPLSERDNAHVRHKSFWAPFTAAYPDALAVFAQCGLPMPESGGNVVVVVQPPVQSMMMAAPSPPMLPFERPDSFQKPRAAPMPPAVVPSPFGRSLTVRPASNSTAPSSKTPSHSRSSSSSKPASSSKSSDLSKPPNSSRSSKTRSSSSHKSKHHSRSSSKSKSLKHHSKTDDEGPLPSPQRPVHPANIIPAPVEAPSKIAVFLGLQESAGQMERRRQEKRAQEREAAREAERLAAQIQRNRERDRERQWHTRKAAERAAAEEKSRNQPKRST